MKRTLHTVWEADPTPEATNSGGSHVVTLGVKAWGPFRDGRFLVNVGHGEYTPAQALALAQAIIQASGRAKAAQHEYDAWLEVQS
jgi:hypothetical protein